MLTSRNVVPYYELPVYRTGNSPAINGIGDGEMLGPGGARPAGPWPEGQSLVVHSSNIQLKGIPNELVLFVRGRPISIVMIKAALRIVVSIPKIKRSYYLP